MMRMLGRSLLLSLLLVCAQLHVAELRAQDGGASTSGLPPELTPSVKTKLTPSKIAVGELAKLTIEVTAPSALQVTLPEQSFGGLELADRRMQSEGVGNDTRTRYELDLLAFEPGAFEVPALTLRLVGPNGELGEAHSEAQRVSVGSLIANEPNAEPKGATKPVAVVQDDYTLAWVALGLAAAALVALTTLFVSRWLKQRQKVLPPPPPPRPPWEIAFDKLRALARQKEQLLEEQRGEEFVDGVSDALREYLGRRYGFDRLERTTGELLTLLEQLRPDKLSLSGVSLLLDQCDLVKFARATPDPDECDDLFNGAIGLVRATIPAPSAAPLPRPSLSPSGPTPAQPPPSQPPPPRAPSSLPPPPRDPSA